MKKKAFKKKKNILMHFIAFPSGNKYFSFCSVPKFLQVNIDKNSILLIL